MNEILKTSVPRRYYAITSYFIEGVQCIRFKLTLESLNEQKNHKMCEEVMTQQAIYEPRSYVNLSMLFDMEEHSLAAWTR